MQSALNNLWQQVAIELQARRPVVVATVVRDALLPVLSSLFALTVMFVVLWRLDAALTLLALAVVPAMIAIFHRYAEPA